MDRTEFFKIAQKVAVYTNRCRNLSKPLLEDCIVVYNGIKYYPQYVQVGYDEWTEASRNLKKKCSLQLYLYLSSNMDGSQWALSPSDICSKTGMARSSYHEAKKELIDKGYMYEHKKDGKTLLYDCYDFYTSPKLNPHIQ